MWYSIPFVPQEQLPDDEYLPGIQVFSLFNCFVQQLVYIKHHVLLRIIIVYMVEYMIVSYNVKIVNYYNIYCHKSAIYCILCNISQ